MMWEQILPGLRIKIFMTIVLGVVYPLAMTGISQALFPKQSNGSLVKVGGKVIGSELIGQNFTKPEYFHPRPSAAGSGYDANNSGGTNLGPTSDKLINGVHKKLANGKDDPGNQDGVVDRVKAYRTENGLAADALVPADAVTSS